MRSGRSGLPPFDLTSWGGRRDVAHPVFFRTKAGLPHRRCLLLVVDVHVLGVDDTFVLLRLAAGACPAWRPRPKALPGAAQSPCTSPRPACGWLASAARSPTSAPRSTASLPGSSWHRPALPPRRSCRRQPPFRRYPSTSFRCCRPCSRERCGLRSARAAPYPRRRGHRLPWPSSRLLPC